MKEKVIPKENIHTVLLWDYVATSFSFTICYIYSCAAKNKSPADPNPFK